MKKQKKNWVLRSMCLVLLLTLVSTCLMSGTLAKYVTTGSGTDTARVAKWGVAITGNGGMFDTTYATLAGQDPDYAQIITNSVASANTDDVVAPGTSGTAAGFAISGTPEVACLVEVTVDKAASKLTGWFEPDGIAPYEPVIWSVNGTVCPAVVESGSEVAAAGSFAALLAFLDDFSVALAPGVVLASTTELNCVISWAWDFHTSDANDVNDTYLGDLTVAPTIELAYAVRVTQID